MSLQPSVKAPTHDAQLTERQRMREGSFFLNGSLSLSQRESAHFRRPRGPTAREEDLLRSTEERRRQGHGSEHRLSARGLQPDGVVIEREMGPAWWEKCVSPEVAGSVGDGTHGSALVQGTRASQDQNFILKVQTKRTTSTGQVVSQGSLQGDTQDPTVTLDAWG